VFPTPTNLNTKDGGRENKKVDVSDSCDVIGASCLRECDFKGQRPYICPLPPVYPIDCKLYHLLSINYR